MRGISTLAILLRSTHHVPSSSGSPRRGDRSPYRSQHSLLSCGCEQRQQPVLDQPGPQVRAVLTGLQAKTPIDLSGILVSEKMIVENGHR